MGLAGLLLASVATKSTAGIFVGGLLFLTLFSQKGGTNWAGDRMLARAFLTFMTNLALFALTAIPDPNWQSYALISGFLAVVWFVQLKVQRLAE